MIFGNWVLALWELMIRRPNASHYLIFQDDCVCPLGLREYLESESGSLPEKAYGNLYTFPPTRRKGNRLWQNPPPAGRTGWYPSNQMGLGAVGILLPQAAAIEVLAGRDHVVSRPFVADVKRNRNVDGAVVETLRKAGWTEMVHSPSLIQHIGKESSIGNREWPRATDWKGERWDVRSLIKRGG